MLINLSTDAATAAPTARGLWFVPLALLGLLTLAQWTTTAEPAPLPQGELVEIELVYDGCAR